MPSLHLLSPRGFLAGAAASGIKSRAALDVAMLICPTGTSAAAVFTTNRVVSAAVKVGRVHVAVGKLLGVVVNSGNANACTGPRGDRDALRMCALAAKAASGRGILPKLADQTDFLPSSTGIIGRHLPMEKIVRGIRAAAADLGDTAAHARRFSHAILTTDLKTKTAAVRFGLGGKTVTLAGTCKGSGMIGPRLGLHATMLAYLTTDAKISPALLRRLLARSAQTSFNAVTVDDHPSTNDTAAIFASGLSRALVDSPRSVRVFSAALDEVCQSLAQQIAADGEGATKLVRIDVRRARSDTDARAIARAIANSPLVKCAMNGNDPNWGRIVSIAGIAPADFDPNRCTLRLQGTLVFKSGTPRPFNAAAVSRSLARPQVVVDLSCGLGGGSATVWTCDLSKQYVTINADYHT